MRTLEQIARRPEDGDVVLMQDGHVRYASRRSPCGPACGSYGAASCRHVRGRGARGGDS